MALSPPPPPFSPQSIKKHLGEEKIKLFVNYCLHYMADLDIPKKR